MAKRDHILAIDGKALSYSGKVIPIRSIAYFEKYGIRKPYIRGSLVVVIPAAVATLLTAAAKRNADFVVPLGAGIFLWLLVLFFIAARDRKYALVLQTTAGDAPRLFMTDDEPFLDRVIQELKVRLEGDKELPRMVVNLKTKSLRMGDVYENVRDATIINRSSVDNSFNYNDSKFDADVTEALRKLAEIITSSGNTQARELFKEFNNELAKSEPRKSLLRTLWDGITRELPALKDMTEIAVKLTTVFA
jgi:hypothetical protein